MTMHRNHPRPLGFAIAGTLVASTSGAATWDAHLRLATQIHDNFTQAPESRARIEVLATTLAAGGALRLGRISDNLELYGFLENVHYDRFDEDSAGGGVGLRLGGAQAFDFYLRGFQGRPGADVGDRFDLASGWLAGASFDQRFGRDWQAGCDLALGDEEHTLRPLLGNRSRSVGGSVRYRGWGSWFSPEVGAGWTRRRVDDPGASYDQRDVFVVLRSRPARWLHLTGRYRVRDRSYVTGDAKARNFGREDQRDHVTLSADIETHRHLSWTIHYDREWSESSREGVDFRKGSLGFGATIEWGSER